MAIELRKYQENDLPVMVAIWNEVVDEDNAFPQDECLALASAKAFFSAQSYTGVAVNEDEVVGLYILHPNNVGRCGHIANASYAVKSDQRGEGIGKKLVQDSLLIAQGLGFKVMQFNAVVTSNEGVIHLYEKLGFKQLGILPNGFRMNDGTFQDIIAFCELLATKVASF